MKILVLILVLGAFATNIRHKKINADDQKLVKQSQNTKDLIQVNENSQQEAPFVEETLSEYQNLEEPKPLYNNDGSSPEMGLKADQTNDLSEAPMMSDDVYDFSAQEQIIAGVSLVQVGEIDALADIDTSLPLMDEDFKFDEQALQETPLNYGFQDQNVQEDVQQEEIVQNEQQDQLQDDIQQQEEIQQEQLLNEVQLLQIGGFYY